MTPEELKEALFKPRLPEDTVDLPSIGIKVRVRGLSRDEAIKLQGIAGVAETERYALSRGMIEPTMTEAEVAKWQAAAPAGELDPVSSAITRLSGMDEDAEREVYKSFRDESDT